MAFRERLAIIVDAVTDGAVRAINGVSRSLDGLGTKVATSTGRMDKFGSTASVTGSAMKGLVGALAVNEVAQFGAASLEAASSLSEAASATEQLFGAAADGVKNFAEGAAAIGLSERAALQASNSFATLFGNIGLGEQDTAAFSESMVRLAADLASFQNLSVDDAMTKLQSGLSGEAEPLRRLGVNINEAAVKSKAMELGLAGTNGELSEGAKRLARYELILEQTNKAQGDFARTAGGLANQQRQAQAQFENQQANLGKNLQGPATRVLENINTLLSEPGRGAVENLLPWGDEIAQKLFGDGKVKKQADEFNKMQEKTARVSETVAAAVRKEAAAQRNGAEARKEAADAAEDAVDAAINLREAGQAVEESVLGVTEAEEALAEAHEYAAEKADRIADAHRDLERANLAVADAQDKVNDAEREIPLRLADARLDLAEATTQVAQAEEALAIARERGVVLDIREAENELKRSRLDLAEQQGTTSDIEADPERELKDARRDLADATDNAKRAEGELRDARDEDTSRRIAAAERDLRDANEEVVTALRHKRDAANEADVAAGKAAGRVDLIRSNVAALTGELQRLGADPAALAGINAIGESAVARAAPISPAQAGLLTSGRPGPSSVTNITVNAQTNASPADIAGAITLSQRTRR